MELFPHHKSYVERIVLLERPGITYRDLAMFMGLAVGEAMVILHELRAETNRSKPESDK
jgi:CRP-like cAMP-binding protein